MYFKLHKKRGFSKLNLCSMVLISRFVRVNGKVKRLAAASGSDTRSNMWPSAANDIKKAMGMLRAFAAALPALSWRQRNP